MNHEKTGHRAWPAALFIIFAASLSLALRSPGLAQIRTVDFLLIFASGMSFGLFLVGLSIVMRKRPG